MEKAKRCKGELEDRLFNLLKLRERLLIADAILRPIAFLWAIAGVAVGGPYIFDPVAYPAHIEYAYSILVFAVYYGLIGAVRRATETYLNKLAVQYGYDPSTESLRDLLSRLNSVKPFKESDDPAIVSFLFTLTRFLPRRGLIQLLVVLAQFVFLTYWAYNYYRYFGHTNAAHFPDVLWKLHAAITLFGIIIMVKNAAFLIDNRFFLALTKAVLDPKGTAEDAVEGLARRTTPAEKVEGAMRDYRFKDRDPPISDCDSCIKGMAKQVLDSVPIEIHRSPPEDGAHPIDLHRP